jgi:CDP-diacylglycerol pyrophosphatase
VVGYRFAILLVFACAASADVRNCICDLTNPAVAQSRGCSLCIEVEKHPAGERIILVRDNDPTKPDRWLAVPHEKVDGSNPLAEMAAEDRLLLWSTAVAKAREVWGDAWGIAMNSDIARRQCHAHVHIGRLLEERETDSGVYIDNVAELPVIADGSGLWFHPAGKRFHVHTGESITETVLMR